MTSLSVIDQWKPLIDLVTDSVSSGESRKAYRQAMQHFLKWYLAGLNSTFSKATIQRYRAELLSEGLASSTINLRLCAIRRLAQEAADNGLLPESTAQAIGRIRGVPQHGTRTGMWLTLEQAEKLILTPDPETLAGKRDRALLGVLIGCGLRRDEAARLKVGDIQLREARWTIVDLKGKGNRTRTVPMPNWEKVLIDQWLTHLETRAGPFAMNLNSHVFWPINRGDRPHPGPMTPHSIWVAVLKHARKAKLGVAPHDLRRTFAKLAHKGRAQLEQIQISLGHASIQTTERYLGVHQDLTDAPCDHLGIRLEEN